MLASLILLVRALPNQEQPGPASGQAGVTTLAPVNWRWRCGVITFWSLQTVQEIRRFKLSGHDMIEKFALHPDRQTLASTAADYLDVPIVLWNIQKGKPLSLPSFQRHLPESKGMSSLAHSR